MINETDDLPMTKQDAIEAFGSLKHLADALGIWPTAIYQWGRACADEAPPADRGAAERSGAKPMSDKYAALRQALDAAHEQASQGKGRERHARDGQDFTEQPIMAITRMVGLGYPCGQAMKKLQEAAGMAQRGQHEAAQREMLGAINYAAAAWIRVDEMVGGGVEGADDGQLMTSDDEPPVAWDLAPSDVMYYTRDADGIIAAWIDVKPVLHGSVWCRPDHDPKMRSRPAAVKNGALPARYWNEPKIWERPAMKDEQPPVPWDKVHPDARFITRDADGSIDAWDGKNRPVLWHNKLWDGEADEMMRLRWPDGDEHEPKIWERPTDD